MGRCRVNLRWLTPNLEPTLPRSSNFVVRLMMLRDLSRLCVVRTQASPMRLATFLAREMMAVAQMLNSRDAAGVLRWKRKSSNLPLRMLKVPLNRKLPKPCAHASRYLQFKKTSTVAFLRRMRSLTLLAKPTHVPLTTCRLLSRLKLVAEARLIARRRNLKQISMISKSPLIQLTEVAPRLRRTPRNTRLSCVRSKSPLKKNRELANRSVTSTWQLSVVLMLLPERS